MKISQLISAIGDENIEMHPLNSIIRGASVAKRGMTSISLRILTARITPDDIANGRAKYNGALLLFPQADAVRESKRFEAYEKEHGAPEGISAEEALRNVRGWLEREIAGRSAHSDDLGNVAGSAALTAALFELERQAERVKP